MKIHIEWDPQAQVTPLEQLPFFIQFLKMGHIFEPWVDECPLRYASNNASKKFNIHAQRTWNCINPLEGGQVALFID